MKVSKKLVIILISVLTLLIGGVVVYATTTTTARADRQLNLGNKYIQEGKYQEAIFAFRKAIEIEPKNIPARLGLGKVYVATNELPKAEAVLKEVIGIDEKNIPAREDLFRVYLKEGNLDRANAMLQEIIQIDPNTEVKQLKADLESAKSEEFKNTDNASELTPTSSTPKQESQTDSAAVTNQKNIQNKIKSIILSPEDVEEIKTEGIKDGYTITRLACYLDISKNIAYFGYMVNPKDPDEADLFGKSIVARVHNPSIYPISAIPSGDEDSYVISKRNADAYNATKLLKFHHKNKDFYFPIIIESSDFEGDLIDAGIPQRFVVYVDK